MGRGEPNGPGGSTHHLNGLTKKPPAQKMQGVLKIDVNKKRRLLSSKGLSKKRRRHTLPHGCSTPDESGR